MKTFTLSKDFTIVCESQKTRYGFRHLATLCRDGLSTAKAKCCYYNRTWECFEFESVLKKIINNNFDDKEKQEYLKAIKDRSKEPSQFKTVAMVASLGNILCKNIKEKNIWKKRMLNTQHGISFPDDFDQLSEKEKARRLDGAIEFAKKT